MRKTVLVAGAVIFIVVECFLVRLILRSGPDSKEFYSTPISELSKPLNDMFFHEEVASPAPAKKRHPASRSLRQSNPSHHPTPRTSGPTYHRSINYTHAEPYLAEPLPDNPDLYPIYGAIVRDPRKVEQAPGDFLGFFLGKAIFVRPKSPPSFIRLDEEMMVVVSKRTKTFFLAPGTISVILKDFSEVDEVAREYRIIVYQRFASLRTAVFLIPVGLDIFALLQEMQKDPRFSAASLDLITDEKLVLH